MAKTAPKKTDQHTHTHDDHAHDHDHDHDHAGHSHSHDHSHPSLPIAPNSQVTVTLKWPTVEPAYQKAIRRYARDMKTDGFRKGKVPLSVVESMVEPSALTEYVLQIVLPEAYSEEIKKADKHPISQPEIEPVQIEKGKDWIITASFAEAPQVNLGKYQAIVKKAIKAADKDISDQEAELVKRAKEAEEKAEKPEEKTDAPAQPTSLTGEQKDELRTRQIFRHLVEEINPQIAELLVRREADREIRRLLEQLDQLKLPVEKYLESRHITADQLRLEYLSSAVTSLQIEFILAEIGKSEKISVEEKEIDDMLKQVFGDKLTDAQKNNSEYRSYVFNTVVKQKIIKYLLSL